MRESYKKITAKSKIPLYEILVLGAHDSGKTSLIYRAFDGYGDQPMSTIAIDCHLRTIDVDRQLVRLIIWELSGHPHYGNFGRDFIRQITQLSTGRIHGIMVLFRETSKASLESAKQYYDFAKSLGFDNHSIILTGVKLPGERQLTDSERSESRKYCDEHGIVSFSISLESDQLTLQIPFYHLVKTAIPVVEYPKKKSLLQKIRTNILGTSIKNE